MFRIVVTVTVVVKGGGAMEGGRREEVRGLQDFNEEGPGIHYQFEIRYWAIA